MFISLKNPKVCGSCGIVHKSISSVSTKQWPVYGNRLRFDYQCFCGSNLMLVEYDHLHETDASHLAANIAARKGLIINAEDYGSDV